MNQSDNAPQPSRRHLITATQVASHPGAAAMDLTRGHHQGNGIRVHGIYFVVVSIAALVLLVIAIAIASSSM